MSDRAPAGRASTKTAQGGATWTSETMSGEGVSNVINQAAAESCIQVPMLETTSEIHSARNKGRRRGLQAEGGVTSSRWWMPRSSARARPTTE